MRPFYISKNRYGYYSVRFVNPETGLMTPYKSTHTADYSEALLIAAQWHKEGTPDKQARQLNSRSAPSGSGIDINKLLTRLTDSEALTLFNALSVRFGNPTLNTTPVTTLSPAPTPVVEAAPSVSDLPKNHNHPSNGWFALSL